VLDSGRPGAQARPALGPRLRRLARHLPTGSPQSALSLTSCNPDQKLQGPIDGLGIRESRRDIRGQADGCFMGGKGGEGTGEGEQPELRSFSRELRMRFGPMLSMTPRRKRCVLPGVAGHVARGAQCARGRNGAAGGPPDCGVRIAD
jgi:hypothetical protein